MLGLGNDAFHIASTHLGTTRVNGGPGNDTITVDWIQGGTQIEGDDPVIPAARRTRSSTATTSGVLRILDSLHRDHRPRRRDDPCLRRRLHARQGRQVRPLRESAHDGHRDDHVQRTGHEPRPRDQLHPRPPLSSTLTYDDTILVNVTQAGAETLRERHRRAPQHRRPARQRPHDRLPRGRRRTPRPTRSPRSTFTTRAHPPATASTSSTSTGRTTRTSATTSCSGATSWR